jgi:signal transduction histidine kinase
MKTTIISNALNETDRIHNLIENALLAARIESHNFQLYKEEFNLTDCVRSTIESRIIPGSKARNITLGLQDDVYIKGDALAISSLILNLVENAEKYSLPNGDIEISLSTDSKNAFLSIADHGIGIPDAEKPKIFEKFYRVGNEDTRNTKGTGLGLFIVRHIVDFHHGEIKVSDNTQNGTLFKVTLPLN